MKVLIILAAVIGVTFSATVTLEEEWAGWKLQYTKSYEDEAIESVRRLVWEDNWRFVQQHNGEGHSFEVEMNEFADLVSNAFSHQHKFQHHTMPHICKTLQSKGEWLQACYILQCYYVLQSLSWQFAKQIRRIC